MDQVPETDRTHQRTEVCLACGAPQARLWRTPDGPARLCQQCATLHDLGCP